MSGSKVVEEGDCGGKFYCIWVFLIVFGVFKVEFEV